VPPSVGISVVTGGIIFGTGNELKGAEALDHAALERRDRRLPGQLLPGARTGPADRPSPAPRSSRTSPTRRSPTTSRRSPPSSCYGSAGDRRSITTAAVPVRSRWAR
jgi:hypothetical protein